MRTARVVLWDFDETLVSRPGKWTSALIEALTEVDGEHVIGPEDVRPGLRGGFPWHRPDESHVHLDSPQAWWDSVAPVLVRAYELAGVEKETAVAAAARVRHCYPDPSRWTVFADSLPAMTRLAEAGWRQVIVSNHVPELPDLVRALGLDAAVDEVLTSAVTGYEKPNPQMFRMALELAGNPERVWMVGDNPVADIEGATRAGIPALLVGARGGITMAQAADRILAC